MVSRRSYLHVAGVGSSVALAGCLGFGATAAPVEIGVINHRETTQTVTIVIEALDDTELVHTKLTVPPSLTDEGSEQLQPTITVSGQFSVGQEYRFTARVTDGEVTTARVSADCSEAAGGQQWAARLTSAGGILVHDDDC